MQLHPNVSTIESLYQEDPYEVYLCEDATRVVKANTSKCGKHIISRAIGTFCYYGVCDLGASMSDIHYTWR
jgi:hypothetical protein